MYCVREWADACSLRELIADGRAAKAESGFRTVIRWFQCVCQGLDAIHTAGLVHGNVKPANILLGRDGRVLIADIDVFKDIDGALNGPTSTSSKEILHVLFHGA
jgi:serine/threonine protein kinase